MLVVALGIGLLVYIVLRLQMLNSEVSWMRQYLIRCRIRGRQEADAHDDAEDSTPADAAKEPAEEPGIEERVWDSMDVAEDIGAPELDNTRDLAMSVVLSADRMRTQFSTLQVEEVESDVELAGVEKRQLVEYESSECSEGAPEP